jgi:hypothetical protein
VFTRDYEWLVELAAKGLSERDNHPMPESVTTPEAFYRVMARAALDAIGLQALLERVARAERKLRVTEEALSRGLRPPGTPAAADGRGSAPNRSRRPQQGEQLGGRV